MAEPEFREEFLNQSKQVLDAARLRLIRQADEASATLTDLLKAKNDNVRLRASSLILEHAARFIELENLTQRIESLEQSSKDQKKHP